MYQSQPSLGRSAANATRSSYGKPVFAREQPDGRITQWEILEYSLLYTDYRNKDDVTVVMLIIVTMGMILDILYYVSGVTHGPIKCICIYNIHD